MKLGSLDFVTTNPFSRPIAAANTSVPATASQAFQRSLPTSSAMTIAVAPGHDASGYVELAADHQQATEHGHNPEERRL